MSELPLLLLLETGLRKGLHLAVSPEERLSLCFLFPTLAIAVAVFAFRERREGGGLWAYLFRRSVWLHPSAVLDYKYIVFTIAVYTPLVSPLVVSSFAAGQMVGGAWEALLGPPVDLAGTTLGVAIFYTGLLEVVSDFRRYVVHAAFHRAPLLWEFHKVHHSAEMLTPITFYRVHPVELYLNATTGVVAVALVTGTFQHLYPQDLSAVTVLGVNAGRFAFDLFGSNLRHSHIWLSYGSLLEHLFISPAQHQIHHSDAPRHFNKNYGSELAIWDWMFGTLYVPRVREELRYGIGPEENRALSSVWNLYARPFRRVRAMLWPPPLRRQSP